QYPYLGFGSEFKREIRVTPKSIKFAMGYWMYANKIAFISSKKEGYGVLIESKEMVEMMKTQHELVWQTSTPITDLPDESIKYLMEIEKTD
ncbi:MAG TPA: hypothetical protein DIV86_07705, partial [Alphaproteobacteria bacterium]|nr:hypothetical protein [Alphaproteobacteria bacterium]